RNPTFNAGLSNSENERRNLLCGKQDLWSSFEKGMEINNHEQALTTSTEELEFFPREREQDGEGIATPVTEEFEDESKEVNFSGVRNFEMGEDDFQVGFSGLGGPPHEVDPNSSTALEGKYRMCMMKEEEELDERKEELEEEEEDAALSCPDHPSSGNSELQKEIKLCTMQQTVRIPSEDEVCIRVHLDEEKFERNKVYNLQGRGGGALPGFVIEPSV
ncbi:unnamed protein product, partial [Amoebophrya sp. A120]